MGKPIGGDSAVFGPIDDDDPKTGSDIAKRETVSPEKTNGNGHVVQVNPPGKLIVTSTNTGTQVDNRYVSYELYNSFNYSVLPKDKKELRYSLGILSPNRAEGKTTAACNFAVSLAVGSKRRTVILDLNFPRPSLHNIFGTPPGPGMVEGLRSNEVYVTPTSIENLFVVPAGNVKGNGIAISHLATFKDIIDSLMREYEIVIVDLPSLDSKGFPTVFCNQLDGLLVVVEAGKTKRRDIERVMRKVHGEQILGFVMNKVKDEEI